MGKIRVDTSILEAQASKLDHISGRLEHISRNVMQTANRISRDISSSGQLRSRINSCGEAIGHVGSRQRSAAGALKTIAGSYSRTEEGKTASRITSDKSKAAEIVGSLGVALDRFSYYDMNGNRYGVTKQQITAGAIATAAGIPLFDKIKRSIMAANASDSFKPSVETSWSAQSVFGDQIKDNVKSSLTQLWGQYVDETRSTKKVEFSQTTSMPETKGVIAGNYKYKECKDVTTAYGLFEEGKLVQNGSVGMRRTLQHVEVYSRLESEADVKLDLGTIDMHAAANMDPKKGNVFVSAGAEADIASIELISSENLKVKAKAGIGAGLDFGISDWEIKCRASAAYKVGAEIEFKVDLKETAESIKEFVTYYADWKNVKWN